MLLAVVEKVKEQTADKKKLDVLKKLIQTLQGNKKLFLNQKPKIIMKLNKNEHQNYF